MENECYRTHIWHVNLTAAFFMFQVIAWGLLLFTDALVGSLIAGIASVIVLIIRVAVDARHVKWHEENDNDD